MRTDADGKVFGSFTSPFTENKVGGRGAISQRIVKIRRGRGGRRQGQLWVLLREFLKDLRIHHWGQSSAVIIQQGGRRDG